MITSRTETREFQIPDKVYCNVCGNEVPPAIEGGVATDLVATVWASWGYGSIKDGRDYQGHLCETCFDAFVATWKIPVAIFE